MSRGRAGGAGAGPRAASAPSGTRPLWLLTVGLLLGSLVLTVAVLPHGAPPGAVVLLPWWVLAGAFLLAEVAVVHYEIRRHAHSFSLGELPLVIGLFAARPQDLVLGVVAGSAVALLLRRQSGLKLLFNLGHLTAGACLAALVFRALSPPGGQPFSPREWAAAFVAVLASALVSMAAIVLALWRTEGRPDPRRLADQALLTVFTAAAASSLGLLGVAATWQHPAGAALLAVPVAALALSHRSFVLQRRERDSLAFLHRTTLLLDEAPDVVTGVGHLLQSACRALRSEHAQLAVVAQHDRRLLLVVRATADGREESGYLRLEDVDPLLRRALAVRTPSFLAAGASPSGPRRDRGSMAAPLGDGDHSRGALLVHGRLGPRGGFSATDLRLIATLAAQVDMSLAKGRLARALAEAAQRADRERENALVLQRGILPPALPRVPGASVAVRYIPGATGVEVGGDWYDVIPLPDGDIGFAIGDVLGHDLEAAARMGQARSALRAYAADGHSPADVVTRLNRLLTRTDPDFMGTCCYLRFQPGAGSVTLVNAGHPPALLLPVGGRPRLVETEPNLPLGVDDDATYTETAFDLPPGGALALYTDGLVETRTMSLEVGLSRLTALESVARGDDAETLAERVLATAPAGSVADDLTLLVLRRAPDATGDGSSEALRPAGAAAPGG